MPDQGLRMLSQLIYGRGSRMARGPTEIEMDAKNLQIMTQGNVQKRSRSGKIDEEELNIPSA